MLVTLMLRAPSGLFFTLFLSI